MWFIGLLTLIFITLKLTGYIDWSWWYVTMPMWISYAIVLGLWILAFVYHIFTTNTKDI